MYTAQYADYSVGWRVETCSCTWKLVEKHDQSYLKPDKTGEPCLYIATYDLLSMKIGKMLALYDLKLPENITTNKLNEFKQI